MDATKFANADWIAKGAAQDDVRTTKGMKLNNP